MVRHEIQDEVHLSLREFLPGDGKSVRATQLFVNDVASHAIGRSYIVLRTKIWKRSAEIIEQAFVPVGNRDARWTPFPNSH
jgi:hypothetical protein